ncbi:MAG: hypothetical protein H6811_04000 [Phycisphaeraceae bacterium]|nr:hypothetical protein [Phycisphaeraceae bacterium]
MKSRNRAIAGVGIILPGVLAAAAAEGAEAQWAVEVVSYDAGSTAVPGYDDPATALGAPERFTGELLGFPSVVSPFNPAFGADELVSIGEGGHLTVRLGRPVFNNAANPFGVDLVIFGNGGFVDASFPHGVVEDPAVLFGLDHASLELSADGIEFFPVGEFVEGFLPAMGYLDSGPYDETPGTIPTSPFTPVDPSLTAPDFAGLDYAGVLALYAGSSGGTPIDIGGGPLPEGVGFSYVRISVPDDGDVETSFNAEVEAIVVVPPPASGLPILAGILAVRRRR